MILPKNVKEKSMNSHNYEFQYKEIYVYLIVNYDFDEKIIFKYFKVPHLVLFIISDFSNSSNIVSLDIVVR